MRDQCAHQLVSRPSPSRLRALSIKEIARHIAQQRPIFIHVLSLRWGDEQAEDLTSDLGEFVLRQHAAGVQLHSEAAVTRALLDAYHELLERQRTSVDALDYATPFDEEEDTDSDED